MTDKEKKCNCEEMTCPKGCSSKHTHKGFSCEKCQPKRYQETYPDKQKTDKEWYCECGEPANEGEHICPKTGGVKLGVFASEIAKELELNPHGEDLIYNKSVSLIKSAKQEAYAEGRNDFRKEMLEDLSMDSSNSFYDRVYSFLDAKDDNPPEQGQPLKTKTEK